MCRRHYYCFYARAFAISCDSSRALPLSLLAHSDRATLSIKWIGFDSKKWYYHWMVKYFVEYLMKFDISSNNPLANNSINKSIFRWRWHLHLFFGHIITFGCRRFLGSTTVFHLISLKCDLFDKMWQKFNNLWPSMVLITPEPSWNGDVNN